MLWKNGQTVGRFTMKIKVKNVDDDTYTVGTCILREVVGNLLISVVLYCCCCIPLIVNLIIIGKNGCSIADGISRSELVSTIYKEDEEQSDNTFNDYLNANITKETNVEDQDFFFNEDEKKDDNNDK
ncbi:MAG: RDD family protein [Clostridium sp.]|nr:MAG: RDD family protein [Clostridium sp.]